MLGSLLSTPVRMAGGGSLTLYHLPGDGLGLHRDVDVCDVTLVTCLYDSESNRSMRTPELGSLRAYPEFCHEPLSAVPRHREQFGISIRLRPGDTAVLLGGIVPHEVTPMAAGQCRVVSLVCYELIDMPG